MSGCGNNSIGDVFRISIPLNEKLMIENSDSINTQANTQAYGNSAAVVLAFIKKNPMGSQRMIASALGLNINSLKALIRKLRKEEKIEHVKTSQKGKWIVKE